jgi:hypothetical protein
MYGSCQQIRRNDPSVSLSRLVDYSMDRREIGIHTASDHHGSFALQPDGRGFGAVEK